MQNISPDSGMVKATAPDYAQLDYLSHLLIVLPADWYTHAEARLFLDTSWIERTQGMPASVWAETGVAMDQLEVHPMTPVTPVCLRAGAKFPAISADQLFWQLAGKLPMGNQCGVA